MRIIVLLLVTSLGCAEVRNTADEVLSQGPEGQPSQAERVLDSAGWLIPSPWRELTVAITGGLAGFWTARRKQKDPAKA